MRPRKKCLIGTILVGEFSAAVRPLLLRQPKPGRRRNHEQGACACPPQRLARVSRRRRPACVAAAARAM
jgi:hypothetical protein